VELVRGALCDGLKVVDLGNGLAGAVAAKMFVEGGAHVTRPTVGPDPFAELYPAYAVWQRGKTLLPIGAFSSPTLDEVLKSADLCILGGEDHPDAAKLPQGRALAAKYPKLVVLEITGAPDTADVPAVDLLAQTHSGYANEHSEFRPIAFAFPLAAYGAALQGVIAALAALCERTQSDKGQLVSTSLLEGGMMWCAPMWFEAEKTDAALRADIPRDVQPLVFRCKDGRYIHFMMGTPGAVKKLHNIFGFDDSNVDPNDRGMPTGKGERKFFWGNIPLFQSGFDKLTSGEALKQLWAAGMGAEMVEPPGAAWSDPQVAHNAVIQTTEDGTRYVGFPIQKVEVQGLPPRSAPPALAKTADKAGPLAGLKVVDIGAFVAGPYLSVVLGDLGAEVIKIEPLIGDVNRSLLRAFACTNRGKRSISVDQKSPKGAEIVRRICLWSDVVHSNSRPGVAAKLRIDAETLQKVKPELVVEETSGYGNEGPKAQNAGFDMLFQALCGHEFRGSGEGDVPLWNRSAIVDFGGGMLGCIGILFALLQRCQGKTPPAVYANLLDTGLFLMSELIQKPDGSWAGAPRMNAALTGSHPSERLYKTADGWIAIAARGDAMGMRLKQALNLDASLKKPVREWGEAEGEAIAAAIAARPRKVVADALAEADVWHACCDLDRRDHAMSDKTLQEYGIVLRTQDRRFGDFSQIGPAFRFSRTPLSLSNRGWLPERGEHNSEILRELGYSDAEIAQFVEQKVVA
jgi:crotonobetainyl-CoA:carnitine CoA-transferase CaiB-like acyl-CoA transferase